VSAELTFGPRYTWADVSVFATALLTMLANANALYWHDDHERRLSPLSEAAGAWGLLDCHKP